MEASNAAASTSVKTVTFREYLSPTEPVFQTIYRSSCLDRPEGTAADDLRLGDVGRNTENSGDQLQNCFQKILHLQVWNPNRSKFQIHRFSFNCWFWL